MSIAIVGISPPVPVVDIVLGNEVDRGESIEEGVTAREEGAERKAEKVEAEAVV